MFGFGFSSLFGIFSITPYAIQRSTPSQTVFQNSQHLSCCVSKVGSKSFNLINILLLSIKKKTLKKPQETHFLPPKKPKKINNQVKSQATQADIFHGTKKIKTKLKTAHHQSSFTSYLLWYTENWQKTKWNKSPTILKTGSSQQRNY